MRRRIGLDAAERPTSAAATLIEQDGMEALRIKQTALCRRTAAARSAMKKKHRQTVDCGTFLDIENMALANRHLPRKARQTIGK
jgi:hypothetical protein